MMFTMEVRPCGWAVFADSGEIVQVRDEEEANRVRKDWLDSVGDVTADFIHISPLFPLGH